MSRAYEFKDAKYLIKEFQNLLKNLSSSDKYVKKYEKEIKNEAELLIKTDYFKKILLQDFNNQTPQEIDYKEIYNIIKAMYCYFKSIELSSICFNLYKSNNELIETYIKLLSKGKNAIKWLFLNKEKKKLKGKKDILLVIKEDKGNFFNAEFITDSYVDTLKYQAIKASLNSAKEIIAINNSNIDKDELAKISKEVTIKRTFVDKEKSKDEESSRSLLSVLSLIIVLPCFMLIMFLVQMIGAEINEEKSTRGMEIIIGNVSAKAHFFSKVLASNLFVLFQGFLLLMYSGIGLIVRKLTSKSSGSFSALKDAASNLDLTGAVDLIKNSGIINKLGYIIPLIIILIILSFLAYSLLAGILASMTTNMENYQQLQTPLMIISVIGYYLIILSTAFPGSTFIKVMAMIPLISVSLAPSLLLSGEIGVGVIIIGIILLILLNYLLVKYGLKVYKVGILNYSESGLWKKMFKAVKEK